MLVNTLAPVTLLAFLCPVGVGFGRLRISAKTDQTFETDLRVLGNEFEVLVGVLVGQFFDE